MIYSKLLCSYKIQSRIQKKKNNFRLKFKLLYITRVTLSTTILEWINVIKLINLEWQIWTIAQTINGLSRKFCEEFVTWEYDTNSFHDLLNFPLYKYLHTSQKYEISWNKPPYLYVYMCFQSNIRQQNVIQNTNPVLHIKIFLLDVIEKKNEKVKQKKENHCSQTDNKNPFLVLFFRKISKELMERKTSYTLSLIPTKNQKERKRKKLLVISIFFIPSFSISIKQNMLPSLGILQKGC